MTTVVGLYPSLVDAQQTGAMLVAVRCRDRGVRIARDSLDSTGLSEIPSVRPTVATGHGATRICVDGLPTRPWGMATVTSSAHSASLDS